MWTFLVFLVDDVFHSSGVNRAGQCASLHYECENRSITKYGYVGRVGWSSGRGAGVVKLSFYRSNPGECTTVPAGIPYSTQHITHIFHIPHIYSHTNRSSPGERLTGYHKWIQMRKFPAPRKSREIILCENKILPSSFTASLSTHLNMATIIKVSTLLCNAWTRWRCTHHRTRYENIRWHISYYISHGRVVRLKRSGGHRA